MKQESGQAVRVAGWAVRGVLGGVAAVLVIAAGLDRMAYREDRFALGIGVLLALAISPYAVRMERRGVLYACAVGRACGARLAPYGVRLTRLIWQTAQDMYRWWLRRESAKARSPAQTAPKLSTFFLAAACALALTGFGINSHHEGAGDSVLGLLLVIAGGVLVLLSIEYVKGERFGGQKFGSTPTSRGMAQWEKVGWAVLWVLWLWILVALYWWSDSGGFTLIVGSLTGVSLTTGTLADVARRHKPAPDPEADDEEATIHGGIHGNAHYAITREVEQAGLFAPDGVPFGTYHSIKLNRVIPLHYAGEPHLITISPNRTGKGTTAIIPTLLEHDASCIVLDPKGQAAAVTQRRRRDMGQEVYFLNPFELHGLPSHSFNPLEHLDPASPHFVAEVAALSEALVIHGGGGDTHWTDSARDLIEALIMWVCFTERDTVDGATLPKVREVLCKPFAALQSDMEKIYTHESGFLPMSQKAGRFCTDSREVQSIVSTAITQTRILDDPAIMQALGASAFHWADLKRKPMTVYLILPAQYLDSHARWLRLVLTSALAALQTTDKPPKPVLFILDEFAQLGTLSAIAGAFGLAAGYSVQLWPILQDLNQLKDLYRTRWETFLANAGMTQLLRANDMTTAEYFSKKMGTYTGKSENLHEGEISEEQARQGFTGTSTGRGDAAVPLARPQELMGLSLHEGIVFVSGMQYPVKMQRQPYYENPRYQGLYDPDPFYPS